MKYLGPVIVGLLLLGVLGWEACQGSRSLAEWQQDTTRTFQGVQAREDSAEAMLALGMRLIEQGEHAKQEGQRLAQRGERAYRSALNLRDSLESIAMPDTCLYWASGWRRAFDSLQVGYDSTYAAFVALRGVYEAQDTVIQGLRSAYALRGESIDSLTALVRRAPTPKRWLPVLTVGYGAVLSDGVVRAGPSVAVGIKVPF